MAYYYFKWYFDKMIERKREIEEVSPPESLASVRNLRTLKEIRDVFRDQELLALSDVAATLASITENLVSAVEAQERTRPAEWMTARQAACYLQRSETAFGNIVAAGEIPKHYLTERGILFNRREVDEWLMERTSPDDCD